MVRFFISKYLKLLPGASMNNYADISVARINTIVLLVEVQLRCIVNSSVVAK